MVSRRPPRLAGYRVERLLGRGGMADVWLAEQVSLRRAVAIKLLSPGLLEHPRALNLFERESLVVASLNHPNIIHVIDRGVAEDNRPFFVMEYVEGEDLARLCSQGRLSTERRLDVLVQICRAIGYAHRNGVIHRDLKPANVLIDDDGAVRLLDFGIAHLVARARSDLLARVGTPDYMAPELRSGQSGVGPASDIWSLGVIMHQLLCGGLPSKPPGRSRRTDSNLPASLQHMIQRCLADSPLQRPATADEVRDCLLQALGGRHLSGGIRARARQAVELARFRLLDVIRDSSFSSVYLFESQQPHELLVIKRMHRDGPGLREARMLMALHHPNVLALKGAEPREPGMVLVMPALSGGSLQQRLASPWPLEDFFPVARSIARGMGFAHRNRILHGNLRPSNVLFDDEDSVRLVDFGLEEHYRNATQANWYRPPGDETLTPALDVYAVGAIWYHMLSGEPPQHACDQDPLEHPAFDALPVALRSLLNAMISPFSGDRPADFDGVLDVLQVADEQAGTATAEWADTDLRPVSPRVRKHVDKPARQEGLRLWLWLPWLILGTAFGSLLLARYFPDQLRGLLFWLS